MLSSVKLGLFPVELNVNDGEVESAWLVVKDRLYEIINAGKVLDPHGRTFAEDPLVRKALRAPETPLFTSG